MLVYLRDERNVTTSMIRLRNSTYAKISPKMVSPRDIAGEEEGINCSDNCTCCHTETEVADQTFYLTQSQYTDIWPTGLSADPVTPVPGRVATGLTILKSLVLTQHRVCAYFCLCVYDYHCHHYHCCCC